MSWTGAHSAAAAGRAQVAQAACWAPGVTGSWRQACSGPQPTQSGLGLPAWRLLLLFEEVPSAPSASPVNGGQAALFQVGLDVLLRVYLLTGAQALQGSQHWDSSVHPRAEH